MTTSAEAASSNSEKAGPQVKQQKGAFIIITIIIIIAIVITIIVMVITMTIAMMTIS